MLLAGLRADVVELRNGNVLKGTFKHRARTNGTVKGLSLRRHITRAGSRGMPAALAGSRRIPSRQACGALLDLIPTATGALLKDFARTLETCTIGQIVAPLQSE
jgi:hypothetical protein